MIMSLYGNSIFVYVYFEFTKAQQRCLCGYVHNFAYALPRVHSQHAQISQIAKNFGSTSIRHRSDAIV